MQSKGLSSLLQHHTSKASVLRLSAFFTVQLSHPHMTTGKIIALTRRTFVGKVFDMLSRLVITFLPRSKRLLISWLQSPSAPFDFDLNQIPYDYTVEVRNRFKELDLIECLMTLRVCDTVQETGIKTIPWKRNAKK